MVGILQRRAYNGPVLHHGAGTGPDPLGRLVERAADDPDVLAVLLFGSVARGEETPLSDIDVCLVLTEAAAARAPDKRREYLGAFDLDVQVFQALPLYVRSRVLREGRVLLSRDDDRLYDLALRTARAFEDFKPIYRTYLEAVRDAGP
jgi:hypothetical protein